MITMNTEVDESYEFPSPSKDDIQSDPALEWTLENQIYIPSTVFQGKPGYTIVDM